MKFRTHAESAPYLNAATGTPAHVRFQTVLGCKIYVDPAAPKILAARCAGGGVFDVGLAIGRPLLQVLIGWPGGSSRQYRRLTRA
jgi:hypothetical protein